MCGHVGVMGGDFNYKEKDIFKQLLIMDSLRGTHGTGVAGFDHQMEATLAKAACNPFELMERKGFDKAVNLSQRVYLGHNRFATQGGHTVYNTHPFDFRRVCGAHNGTIPQFSKNKLEGQEYFDTDSEAIFNQIDTFMQAGQTYDDALDNTISKLTGAWALVFVAKRERKLVMIRNSERPMFYCYDKDRMHLYWASELWMLHAALGRNGVEMDGKPYVLPENKMTSWDIPRGTRQSIQGPIQRDIIGFKYPQTVHYTAKREVASGGGNPHMQTPRLGQHQVSGPTTNGTNTSTSGTVPAANNSSSTEEPKPLAEVHYIARPPLERFPNEHKGGHFRPPYKDPYTGLIIKKTDVEEMLAKGGVCTYCDAQPVYGEEICFLKPSDGRPNYLCQKCVKDTQVMKICQGMR